MTETGKTLIYLVSCGLNGTVPDGGIAARSDLRELYALAKRNSLAALVSVALKRAGISDGNFISAYNNAIRKIALLDNERKEICSVFEKEGIEYMPLKGSELKDYYPLPGMREMSDVDILIDPSKRAEVKDIMLGRGYTAETYGRGNHDAYLKKPVLNFEMHTALFPERVEFSSYYSDVLKNAEKEEGFARRFRDEDFYLYITAHEYKHFSNNGTGLRSLADRYVFIREKGDGLDWNYIESESAKLGISEYEKEGRELALKLFSASEYPVFTPEEEEKADSYLSSGTYGSVEQGVEKELTHKSKLSYMLGIIFLPRKQMAQSVPFTAKCVLLYPAGVVWRIIRVFFRRRKQLKATLGAVKDYDKQ